MTTPESFSDTPPGYSDSSVPGGRLHRPDAQREAPIRNVFTSRTSKSDKSARSAEAADKLAYGVDLGYNVINEQIAKAKDLAAQWSGPGGTSAKDSDWRHIASRMLHAYQDLGAVCLDAMQKLVDNLSVEEAISAAQANGTHSAPERATASLPINVTIKLRTNVLAEADLKLATGCGTQLSVAALHGPDGTTPITSCVFSPTDAQHVELMIDVTAGTPPGAYSGVVVDTHSNEPCGTLCVRVGTS